MGPALRFALVCEALALSSLGLVLGSMAWLVAPQSMRELVSSGSGRTLIAALGAAALALMLGVHWLWGFAMELGVFGGGVAAPTELVNKKSGGGGRSTGGDEGVDDRPTPSFPPPFRMPNEIKAQEKDAYLALSFCVDVSGRPYDIRVTEEKPPGLGMAAAGREAIQQTRFTPAKKGGLSVPFCGLEQPFEVRFSN